LGCVANELGIPGDAAGVWIFLGCLSQGLHGIFPRQYRGFKEFRGFLDMELGIFRVAKSSGGGRGYALNREVFLAELTPT